MGTNTAGLPRSHPEGYKMQPGRCHRCPLHLGREPAREGWDEAERRAPTASRSQQRAENPISPLFHPESVLEGGGGGSRLRKGPSVHVAARAAAGAGGSRSGGRILRPLCRSGLGGHGGSSPGPPLLQAAVPAWIKPLDASHRRRGSGEDGAGPGFAELLPGAKS